MFPLLLSIPNANELELFLSRRIIYLLQCIVVSWWRMIIRGGGGGGVVGEEGFFWGGWVEGWVGVGERCRSQKRRDEPLIGWGGMVLEEEGEGRD